MPIPAALIPIILAGAGAVSSSMSGSKRRREAQESERKTEKRRKKESKIRSKENERETQSGLLHDTLQRGAELEAEGLMNREKIGKRRTRSFQDTADLVREALKI